MLLRSLVFFLPLPLVPAQKWYLSFLSSTFASLTVIEHTRCGKLYKTDKINDPPDGQFPVPASLEEPHLALRCNPVLIPFLPDDNDPANPSSNAILVDALVRTTKIRGAQPLGTSPPVQDTGLFVDVFLDGEHLTSGKVPLNGSAALPFNLSDLSPRENPYDLTCTATLSSSSRSFKSIPAELTYLPFPDASIGSFTKLDLRTGGLLAKRANDSKPYKPIFPMGFYIAFGGYLEGNLSVLEDLKDEGCDSPDVSGRLFFDIYIDSGSTSSVPFCCPLVPE